MNDDQTKIQANEAQYALVKMSRYAGIRSDLVQAGGGNSSVKVDEKSMLIKASGINLSDVEKKSGVASVDYQKIRAGLQGSAWVSLDKQQREQKGKTLLESSNVDDAVRPSIETFLHGVLNTYTLHTHPISVNVVAARADWREVFTELFPDAMCVPYGTPGIDLTLQLMDALYAYEKLQKRLPNIVFLQNHGLIASASHVGEVERITEHVCAKLDSYLDLNFSGYKAVTNIQDVLLSFDEQQKAVLKSDDNIISQCLGCEDASLALWPFCPDMVVYCGVRPLFSNLDNFNADLADYLSSVGELPKVLVLDDSVYFTGVSLKKAREAEELFKFHLQVVSAKYRNQEAKFQRLDAEELAYLTHWDAEKYRQEI